MSDELQSMPDVPSPTSPETTITPAPAQAKNNLIAPLWHTLLIVAILLTFSFLGSSPQTQAGTGPYARIIVYSGTFLFELIVVLLIWFWIRRSGLSMRELIGGRWTTPESFLLDIGIAVGFLIAANAVLVGLRVALGTLDLHNMDKQLGETKRMLGHLIPRSKIEAGLFVVLSVAAGLFEEIIFRGYLQRQFGAITRSAYAGIIASAAIFGLSHAYQGGRMMIVIGVYGALFGLLAHLRKSLRPGMMAHATQDAFAGIALFFLAR
ncbi:MAG: type II CAAX endopeptidase family protein [Candidatus Angelobacter sp.]